MKRDVLLILCGLCGGVIPSLFVIRHIDLKMIRARRLCRYMRQLYRNNG